MIIVWSADSFNQTRRRNQRKSNRRYYRRRKRHRDHTTKTLKFSHDYCFSSRQRPIICRYQCLQQTIQCHFISRKAVQTAETNLILVTIPHKRRVQLQQFRMSMLPHRLDAFVLAPVTWRKWTPDLYGSNHSTLDTKPCRCNWKPLTRATTTLWGRILTLSIFQEENFMQVTNFRKSQQIVSREGKWMKKVQAW